MFCNGDGGVDSYFQRGRKLSFHVYVLFSESLGKYYVGQSLKHTIRLTQHNRGQSHWTSRASDWKEVFNVLVDSRVQARELEKRIKARGAKRFIADQQEHSSIDS
jgi:putative endonuclease